MADLDLTHVQVWTGMPDEDVMWRARGSALLDTCTDELASVRRASGAEDLMTLPIASGAG